MELTSFKRLGSGPLAAGADGRPRRIVYYNAVLTLRDDLDVSSWSGLNVASLANLLGATEQGITGLSQEGNEAGDQLYVHGTATFVRDGDDAWQPVSFVQQPVAEAPPEDNTGLPAETRRIIEQIQALVEQGGDRPEQRREIIAEELGKAYNWMTIRLDRLGETFVIAGGPRGGEYEDVADIIAGHLTQRGLRSRAAPTAGSAENARLLNERLADVGLIQNDIAALALNGEGFFRATGPMPELRALASLFPEPVHVVLPPNSSIASIEDLRGKRVDIGLPDSGTRIDALALLRAFGLQLEDLGSIGEAGLAGALPRLAAGELDAVIATVGAPARSLQELAATSGMTLLSLSPEAQARLQEAEPNFVPVTLPRRTYPGQNEAVGTVAVTALLVGHGTLPDAEVETLLTEVFGGIDFVRAGSTAGSLISRATATEGVTIPMHPAAERFFAQPAAAATQ
jgi:TRAP transporter TAXI family solute receptor